MRTIEVEVSNSNQAVTDNPKGGLNIGEVIKFVFTDKNKELNTVVEKWGMEYTCMDCSLNQEKGVRACIMCPTDDGHRLLCAQESGDIVFLPLDTLMEGI